MAKIIEVDDGDKVTLHAGGIYRFSSPTVKGEHRFILCLLTDDNHAHFVCCTSQVKTIEKFVKIYGFDESTMPKFNPTEQNKFSKPTYVNCNVMQTHKIWELQDKLYDYQFEQIGCIGEGDFEQIKFALKISESIADIIPNSMKYESISVNK